MARLAIICLLGLTLLSGCPGGEKGDGTVTGKAQCTYGSLLEKEGLVIVALSSFTKKRIHANADDWRPTALLGRSCQGPATPVRIEIDDRTEFYAFYSPLKKLPSGEVLFRWYFGKNQLPYARPVLRLLRKHPGFSRPLAVDYIWSAPGMGGKLLSMGGLRSVRNKADWERSRVFGPRTLRISLLKGFEHGRPVAGEILAEVSFEIHETGVRVY